MQVTVLMPIYNAERYLCDAIDSLLRQTSDAWKLICIDDGSTDGSAKMVEEYCQKDERITLIKQPNAGPAVARAKAIQLADTEYVSILDSDDIYSSDYVELMLKRAEETLADIIVPDVCYESEKQSDYMQNLFLRKGLPSDLIVENGMDAFGMTIPWKLHGWQMIRTSLAQEYYTIENASYSKYNSDEYITRLLYLKSKKTALCNAVYIYRIFDGSLTRTVSLKKFDYLITLDKLLDLCQKEQVRNEIIVELYNMYYVTLISMWKLTRQLSDIDKKVGQDIVKRAYYNSYRKGVNIEILNAASMRTKIKLLISIWGFNVIKFFAK